MISFRRNESEQWQAIRSLQEENRQLKAKVEDLEEAAGRLRSRWNWFVGKFVPIAATVAMAFAALDTVFKWTM